MIVVHLHLHLHTHVFACVCVCARTRGMCLCSIRVSAVFCNLQDLRKVVMLLAHVLPMECSDLTEHAARRGIVRTCMVRAPWPFTDGRERHVSSAPKIFLFASNDAFSMSIAASKLPIPQQCEAEKHLPSALRCSEPPLKHRYLCSVVRNVVMWSSAHVRACAHVCLHMP